ncbi:hypothetical protein PG996_000353 [Apiospora saccharicola]|uniref:DUS-like FMN-binding domain-containing protein n=1 Tax=Apiospora saccharicola TaxID=335842 RepID=A0ABR1WDJ1_9PEZI
MAPHQLILPLPIKPSPVRPQEKKFEVDEELRLHRQRTPPSLAPLPTTTSKSDEANLEVVRKLCVRGAAPNWRLLVRGFASMASNANANPAVAATATKPKLHGRAFYESIGSPKFVVAPMVDQSEFVCTYSLSFPQREPQSQPQLWMLHHG